jgi:hypothetical protein
MPLKVIGAGFGRTGTLSAYTALNQRGFPCYHMFGVLENKQNTTHLDFWRKEANAEPGAQQDWEAVFKNYTATVDNPACCVWSELLGAPVPATAYPNVNDRAAINQVLKDMTRGAYVILAVAALAVSALACRAWRVFN